MFKALKLAKAKHDIDICIICPLAKHIHLAFSVGETIR